MREIKFRAWDGSMMINRGLHDRNWYTSSDKMVKGTHPNDKRELQVMQYTGLKDKNGKEIYEGDIVLFNIDKLSTGGKKKYHTGATKEIKGVFQWGYSCWMISSKERVQQYRVPNYTWIEVIGNIHENPELIK